MQVVEAIMAKTGLTYEQAKEAFEAVLDFGIPIYSIEELDGWYSDLDDLLADSRMYDEPMTVTFAVEFDRKPVLDGELL